MADETDKDSKTEDATEKRIRDALDKGQTPTSREPAYAVSLVAIAAAIAFLAPAMADAFSRTLVPFLSRPEDFPLENAPDAIRVLSQALVSGGSVVLGITAMLFGAGVVASFVQGQPRLVWDRIIPDKTRISPGSGLKRILGWQGAFELFKGVIKIGAVTGAAYIVLRGSAGRLSGAVFLEPSALPHAVQRLIVSLALFTAAAIALLAGVDVVWSRRKWQRDLRMSKQEIKNEAKESEGDVALKNRLRSAARARIRKRMMANVPRATLVVVNPTHYAVALRYVRQEGGAPVVLAKGKDLIALKIRDVAEAQGITIFEDQRLARSLHDGVEVGQTIPPEFYKAVAEIIIFLSSRSKPLPRS